MRWIRLNIDFDNSSWLFPLSAAAQMAWIKLLCHVKRDGIKGRCKALSPQVAAARFGVPLADVEQMLNAAAEDQALAVEDGYWIITGWTEYQEHDSRGAERVRRHRARQAEDLPFEEERSAGLPPRTPVHGASAPSSTDRQAIESQSQPNQAKEPPEGAGCIVPAAHANRSNRLNPEPSEGAGCVVPAAHAPRLNPCNGVTTVTPPVTRHATETETETQTQTKTISLKERGAENPVWGADARPAPPADPRHEGFNTFWKTYPPRSGDRKRCASEAIYKQLVKQGVDPQTLNEGAQRYAQFCEATGKLNTEFVQQATTWLKNRAWENDFAPAAPKEEPRNKPQKDLDFWEAEPETIFVDGRGQEIDAETYAQNRRHCGTALRRRFYWIRRGEKTREPFTEDAWHDQRRPA